MNIIMQSKYCKILSPVFDLTGKKTIKVDYHKEKNSQFGDDVDLITIWLSVN